MMDSVPLYPLGVCFGSHRDNNRLILNKMLKQPIIETVIRTARFCPVLLRFFAEYRPRNANFEVLISDL
jgi:hypothetical protein